MVKKKSRSSTVTKNQKTLNLAIVSYPHLKDYVEKIKKEIGTPAYYTELDREMKKVNDLNIIYPVGDHLFVHIVRSPGEPTQYNVIEPKMDKETKALYDKVMDKMIEIAHRVEVPDKIEDAGPILIQLLDSITAIDEEVNPITKRLSNKVHVDQVQYDTIRYFILRNRVGYSKLEPLFNDPYLEDIHCTGVGNIKAVHKIFDAIYMNLEFLNDYDLNKYILETSERVERPVSDARPVVDAVMPDGSRVNFIYGREISLEGSSFTVRKFSEVPTSIVEILNYKTMDPLVAAYIWMALENGMNIFVCGETASGKTTTLNACATFIKPDAKVYTVENTAEVTMPHDTWQHLLTREMGNESDVTIFDLLIAALRSRPNYIIVGEIRGKEGNVAFQAMQTGHPVMSTFHAGSPHTMIQRLTGEPINVPIAFIDNLNIVLIQQAVQVGGMVVRRVLQVTEIEKYYDVEKKMITRDVFTWDPITDEHRFRGYLNSYILEKKIATALGYTNTREIYKELELRAKVLRKMWDNKIFNYYEVWDIIKKFNREGIESLPFAVE